MSHTRHALGMTSSEAPITLHQPGLAGNKLVSVKEGRVPPTIYRTNTALIVCTKRFTSSSQHQSKVGDLVRHSLMLLSELGLALVWCLKLGKKIY